jgi:hypothetical protein
MKYYRIFMHEANKVWRKYIIFAERFLYNNNEIAINQIHKAIASKDYSLLNNLTIQALDHTGNIVFNQNKYEKQSLPNFVKIRKLFLLKTEIYDEALFENINEMETFTVKLEGMFADNYKLLCFKNIVDCVDFNKSIIKEFETFSKMILDKTKIPENINGFFLIGWDRYGQYENIVNEYLMKKLLTLKSANEFLIFKEINYE